MPKAKVNGAIINYKVHGQGEPLVLIMGFAGPQWAWVFQTRAFKKGYRVITFDNRGVGKTQADGPAQDGPCTLKTMADDTIGLMDHLGIDKAHILGASMGGMIAQEIAINYPQRVSKLVLACTSAETSDVIANVAGEGLDGLSPELEARLGETPEAESFTEEDIGSIDVAGMLSSIVSLAMSNKLVKGFIVPVVKIYVKLGGFSEINSQIGAIMTHSTTDRLQAIKAPTLVITGTDDRLMPPRCSDALAAGIEGAKLVKIDGGSHAFFAEKSGAFNKAILDFLQGS